MNFNCYLLTCDLKAERKHCFLKFCRTVNILPQFYPFLLNAWNSISNMRFHFRVSFFFLHQTWSFYILILISTLAKLRRMQIQISNIITLNFHLFCALWNEKKLTYFAFPLILTTSHAIAFFFSIRDFLLIICKELKNR